MTTYGGRLSANPALIQSFAKMMKAIDMGFAYLHGLNIKYFSIKLIVSFTEYLSAIAIKRN